MKRFFLIFLITLILGILGVILTSYPLLFLWMICLIMIVQEKEGFYLAFFSGFLVDFLKEGVWGETSLFFLLFTLVVSLYKRKFKVIHPLYFFPFVMLAVGFYEFWEFREIGGIKVFWSLVIAMSFFKIAQIVQIKRIGRIGRI